MDRTANSRACTERGQRAYLADRRNQRQHMRKLPRPLPTEEQSIAISTLLLERARAGEFGYCAPGRPIGIWDNAPKFWRFGSEGDQVYLVLDCWRASALALGEFTVDQIPPLSNFRLTRFPKLGERLSSLKKPAVPELGTIARITRVR